MRILQYILLVSHFLASYFISSLDLEVSPDGVGTLTPPPATPATPEEVSTTFYNQYTSDTLQLLWQGSDGDEVIIGQIQPLSSMGVNTYTYHTFYARSVETKLLANPKTVRNFLPSILHLSNPLHSGANYPRKNFLHFLSTKRISCSFSGS